MRAIRERTIFMGIIGGLVAAMLLLGAARAADNTAAAATPDKVSAPAATAKTISGTIAAPGRNSADANKWMTITLTLDGSTEPKPFTVVDPDARATLLQAQINDRIVFESKAADPDKPMIDKVDKLERTANFGARLIAVVAALVLILACAWVATGGQPQAFMLGADNRYSNSKTQIALWFGTVATLYAAAVGLRIVLLGWDFVGGVGLTQNLILLTGFSALTFGGAKAITVNKITNAASVAPPIAPPAKPAARKANFLADLVQNDRGQFDIGDFQMMLITIAAVGIFALSAFHFLGTLELAKTISLPDVDSTLLSGFGLGQGAYLIKKAASNPGDG